jgi:hypothetical protein
MKFTIKSTDRPDIMTTDSTRRLSLSVRKRQSTSHRNRILFLTHESDATPAEDCANACEIDASSPRQDKRRSIGSSTQHNESLARELQPPAEIEKWTVTVDGAPVGKEDKQKAVSLCRVIQQFHRQAGDKTRQIECQLCSHEVFCRVQNVINHFVRCENSNKNIMAQFFVMYGLRYAERDTSSRSPQKRRRTGSRTRHDHSLAHELDCDEVAAATEDRKTPAVEDSINQSDVLIAKSMFEARWFESNRPTLSSY